MNYCNGKEIIDLKTYAGENNIYAEKAPYQYFRENKQEQRTVPLSYIIEDAHFDDLFKLWITPMVAVYRFCNKDNHPENDNALEEHIYRTLHSNTIDAGETFLNEWCSTLTHTLGPYNAVYSEIDERRACKDITSLKDIAGFPYWLYLRIMTLSCLANLDPSEMFKEGAGWRGNLTAPYDKTEDVISVSEGRTFPFDPAPQNNDALKPVTLVNNSDDAVSVKFNFSEKEKSVTIPAKGMLRAVRKGGPIVSVKGAVSFSDSSRAIIQTGADDGTRKLWYADRMDNKNGIPIPCADRFLDACADERGGALILDNSALYSTYCKVKPDKLPIRIYRAGKYWGKLYADGDFETNIVRDGLLRNVASVIEDGDRGLLYMLSDGTGMDYRVAGNTFNRNIQPDPFFDTMFSRFQDSAYCEKDSTQMMTVCIDQKGGFKIEKYFG